MGKYEIIKKLKNNNDLLIGVYIGVWCGDGTQYYDNGYRIKVCCHSKDEELIQFYKDILQKLFNKKKVQVVHEVRNRCLVRFNSKFIYQFVNEYVQYKRNKTHTVCLKKKIKKHTLEFLRGFLLGIILTDGYLKKRLYINVTSEKLSQNSSEILKIFGFTPHTYIHKRKRYGWKDLHMVSLTQKESKNLKELLDRTIKELGIEKSFKKIKYGPAEI